MARIEWAVRSGRRCWKGKFGRTIAGGVCALFGEKKQERARSARRSFFGLQAVRGGQSRSCFFCARNVYDERQPAVRRSV